MGVGQRKKRGWTIIFMLEKRGGPKKDVHYFGGGSILNMLDLLHNFISDSDLLCLSPEVTLKIVHIHIVLVNILYIYSTNIKWIKWLKR